MQSFYEFTVVEGGSRGKLIQVNRKNKLWKSAILKLQPKKVKLNNRYSTNKKKQCVLNTDMMGVNVFVVQILLVWGL